MEYEARSQYFQDLQVLLSFLLFQDETCIFQRFLNSTLKHLKGHLLYPYYFFYYINSFFTFIKSI